ncbi:hypothetical protein PR202_ga18722 [Eleusine coracana subsp. coracana]|uniref:Protein kinase domain-containing protein n=1 Tax=Eleusine coracana subsp. coracana TaxID=191504 RepID=A0AAV5CTX2_ELECO|nr:hypothetical protein PR202_ga18722 [Eleusine coracana subsp. coracana]
MASRQHNAQFHKSKTLDNKYMLGDEIGKGAYGRVYKGLDLENGDFVAIKQVSLENIPQEDLNIIMGLVKLADFGVATKLTEADINTHSVVGTPYWMAPEVIEMSGVCAASDIWSVGCTVIELLTCAPPYYDLQPMPALFRIVQDAMQRPDAKTLLMHPWLQNSRRALPSLRQPARSLRNIDGDDEGSSGDNNTGFCGPTGDSQTSIVSTIEQENERKEPILESVAQDKVDQLQDENLKPTESSSANNVELTKDSMVLNKDPTLVFHEKLPLESPPGDAHSDGKVMAPELLQGGLSSKIELENKEKTNLEDGDVFSFQAGRQNIDFHTVAEPSVVDGPNELSRFSDKPGDASLEDLFPSKQDYGPEASTSAGQEHQYNGRQKDLANTLKATIAQKQQENNNVPINGGKLVQFIMQLREEEDGPGFGDNIAGESLYPLQIICSVLQLINCIIKDNPGFLENACLVGLIPVVMSFAEPTHSKDVRMQASLFLQQLCQASTMTLQMFIACQGIPVLVGFLEPDYAKYRDMVHLAIDGIWQVFKLQHSTQRNDFCRIAAKKGILIRLVNTLHSLNEATRFASISGSGASATQNGSTPRRRSGQIDPSMLELSKTRLDHHHSSGSLQSLQSDADKHHILMDPTSSPRFSDKTGAGNLERNENDLIRPQRLSVSTGRTSTDRSPKHIELVSNGHNSVQNDQIRPLLSLLEKEPPSRHVSGQLDYARHLSGLEKHETILPLLHSSTERKTYGELDLLMTEFTEVRQGKENGPFDSGKASNRVQRVLNLRPGSTTSSGPLAQMFSSMSADVAREYLEKVADLLLEFAQADTVVKSLMSTQSLLARLFQMFNKIEPPILLKILRCINHLSGDPNCLETLQRTDAIKHLIPILELHDGPLVYQIHSEVLNALFNLCKINKRRQEQAAENGIIPHLMNFVMSDSPLRQKSSRINTAMATNGLTTLLIARLDHREAIARLTLLKLIKVVYEHHPRPKQLIVENDLPQKLQNLIEERRDGQRGGQQVLVKQMATSLLKALHINTVL